MHKPSNRPFGVTTRNALLDAAVSGVVRSPLSAAGTGLSDAASALASVLARTATLKSNGIGGIALNSIVIIFIHQQSIKCHVHRSCTLAK